MLFGMSKFCARSYQQEIKMELKTILEMIEKKYPRNNHILAIYDDGSGRIVSDPLLPVYEQIPVISFDDVEDLVSQLKDKEIKI